MVSTLVTTGLLWLVLCLCGSAGLSGRHTCTDGGGDLLHNAHHHCSSPTCGDQHCRRAEAIRALRLAGVLRQTRLRGGGGDSMVVERARTASVANTRTPDCSGDAELAVHHL